MGDAFLGSLLRYYRPLSAFPTKSRLAAQMEDVLLSLENFPLFFSG